jgi:iron complex transport system ATP-binding protein
MSQGQIARRLGYVPQRNGDTRLTVFEAVLLGRKAHMGLKTGTADYTVVEKIIGQTLTAEAIRQVYGVEAAF